MSDPSKTKVFVVSNYNLETGGQQSQHESTVTDKRELIFNWATIYSIIVVIAATFLHGTSQSLSYSIGSLFVDWTEILDSSKSETAWVISINLGLLYLTGM